LILALALCCAGFVPVAQAQFPAGPADDAPFNSTAVFKVTLSANFPGPLAGQTVVVWANGPTCVGRSAVHAQGVDPSGGIGDATQCGGSPSAGTSDAQIGLPFPTGFNAGGGLDELHTEIYDMLLQDNLIVPQWQIRAGQSATCAGGPANLARSLGEVESRVAAGGFPADSFFNLYLDVVTPGGQILYNASPLTVTASGITSLPPWGAAYLHSFNIVGRVALYDCTNGCFAGWLEQGTHGVQTGTPGTSLHDLKLEFPVIYSVDVGAEGLIIPDPCHPEPNDVYALGPFGGYATEGELFQSSGRLLGAPPDLTNMDRISAALGVGPPPAPPPYVGPFAPATGAPNPTPPAPGGPTGSLGLAPGDNINAVSFGLDNGDTLLFSIDPGALGLPGTAVEFHAQLSPMTPAINGPAGSPTPSNGGGDPGDEAAGDIYVSSMFGWFGNVIPGAPVLGGLGAAPFNSNLLGYDELKLGLQAPAQRHTVNGAPEDDLDALEADDGSTVDADGDGIAETHWVFFSLDPNSTTVMGGLAFPEDIYVSTLGAVGNGLYAGGQNNIRLVAGDDLDALVLNDVSPPPPPAIPGPPNGVLDPGVDTALFSLAAGSPSLLFGNTVNPSMPGPGPFSPGTVFWTNFTGAIVVYASAGSLGLQFADELNALDIGWAEPCEEAAWREGVEDSDFDGVPDPCDNCPNDPNQYDYTAGEQADSDGDGHGDVCDNCPREYNPDQGPCEVGACCLVDGSCVDLKRDECESIPGGQFQGEGTACPWDCRVRGACCLEDGRCVDGLDQDLCELEYLGQYMGDGTTCDQVVCETAGVPAVTSFGLIVLTLLAVAGGVMAIRQRRRSLA